MAANDRTQTNGIIEKREWGIEILLWLDTTGLTPMGLLKNERGQWNFIVAGNDRTQTNRIIKNVREGVKFYIGWK